MRKRLRMKKVEEKFGGLGKKPYLCTTLNKQP